VKPAVPKELLALVPEYSRDSPTNQGVEESWGTRQSLNGSDFFGDSMKKKNKNILRVGFQNTGGWTLKRHKIKDDLIRRGITKYEFDIFGFAETNIDWRLLPEQEKTVLLYKRMVGINTHILWKQLH
jgi:hypothetical protein